MSGVSGEVHGFEPIRTVELGTGVVQVFREDTGILASEVVPLFGPQEPHGSWEDWMHAIVSAGQHEVSPDGYLVKTYFGPEPHEHDRQYTVTKDDALRAAKGWAVVL